MEISSLVPKWRCTIQIGGAETSGKYYSGLEIYSQTRRAARSSSYGLKNTYPLMLKADGTKCWGKTTGRCRLVRPWKDKPHDEFLSILAKSRQIVTCKYLKYFTFLTKEEIDALAWKSNNWNLTSPEANKKHSQRWNELYLFTAKNALTWVMLKRLQQLFFPGDVKSLDSLINERRPLKTCPPFGSS